jgi:hypothetical protein
MKKLCGLLFFVVIFMSLFSPHQKEANAAFGKERTIVFWIQDPFIDEEGDYGVIARRGSCCKSSLKFECDRK